MPRWASRLQGPRSWCTYALLPTGIGRTAQNQAGGWISKHRNIYLRMFKMTLQWWTTREGIVLEQSYYQRLSSISLMSRYPPSQHDSFLFLKQSSDDVGFRRHMRVRLRGIVLLLHHSPGLRLNVKATFWRFTKKEKECKWGAFPLSGQLSALVWAVGGGEGDVPWHGCSKM